METFINDPDEPNMTFKLILIGDYGVGKTSLIQKFAVNNFSQEYISTKASTFETKYIENKKGEIIKIVLWDTAGQEKYRSISKNFFQDAQAIIMVYDITDKQSLESIVEFWFKELNKYREDDVLFYLVGNKCDLDEQRELIDQYRNDFLQMNDMKYMEVSSFSGLNVAKLFEEVITLLYEKECKSRKNEMFLNYDVISTKSNKSRNSRKSKNNSILSKTSDKHQRKRYCC